MRRDVTPSRRDTLRRFRKEGYADATAGAAYGSRQRTSVDEAERLAYDTGWHLGRRDRLGIPVPPSVNEIDAEDYARGLYCEEVGESLVVVGSGQRFGYDAPGRDGTADDSPRRALAKEMGDVLAAIEYACLSGLVDRQQVEAMHARKLAKLLDPQSQDNLGRRLAPPPLGYDERQMVP